MKLNPKLDLGAHRRAYKKHRRVQIDDFLEARSARAVFDALEQLGERELWFRASSGDPARY